MNSMTIIGNLTRDPQTFTRSTANGPQSVTNFTVACNGRHKDAASFVRVSAWGNAGLTIAKHAGKGSKIMVKGEPSISVYTDKSGRPAATQELRLEDFEFLTRSIQRGPAVEEDFGYSAASSPAHSAVSEPYVDPYEAPAPTAYEEIEDDDLPW